MRTRAFLAALLIASGPTTAQDLPPSRKGGPIPGDAPGHESCVEVEIGSAKAYDCLNTHLKEQVERVKPVPNIPPIDARSPDIDLGIVNIPAVRQQYGKNFGVSVVPQRPTRGGQ